MVFASPLFLFLFLPLTLTAYFASPPRYRNATLLLASAAFYAAGESNLWPLLACIVINWIAADRIAGAVRPGERHLWLASALALDLTILAVFKYAGFALENMNALRQWQQLAPAAWQAWALPLGISFFTFHAISYVVDVHRGIAPADRGIARFALYITLFPQLIAGPIVRWRDIAGQLACRTYTWSDGAYGARRFVVGLGKKTLIANPLGGVADDVFALRAETLSCPVAWLGLACYTLQIYFDFSGYSDMAIGLMRGFGLRIAENFNFPYIARSVRDFWRRWHISLSGWFRDYVYIPLGGNRQQAWRVLLVLVLVFFLAGLWHGARWTFVLWGLWHGLFMLTERTGLDRALDRTGGLAHVYTLAVVAAGWVLFRCDTLGQAGHYFSALLSFSAGDGSEPLARFLDPAIAAALAAGIVGSTPWPAAIARRAAMAAPAGARAISESSALLTLLVLCAACLAAGSYNPFIYFRF